MKGFIDTFFFPLSIPYIIFASLVLLPPYCSRNSDRGSHSRPFSPPLHYVRALHLYREKGSALPSLVYSRHWRVLVSLPVIFRLIYTPLYNRNYFEMAEAIDRPGFSNAPNLTVVARVVLREFPTTAVVSCTSSTEWYRTPTTPPPAAVVIQKYGCWPSLDFLVEKGWILH